MNAQQDMQAFDLNKFRVKVAAPETTSPAATSNQNTDQPFDLEAFRYHENPTHFQEFKRHAARTGSRVTETIAGFPGDFVKFVDYLGSKLPKVQVTSQENNPVLSYGKKALEKFPTSEELKEFSQKYTKGYTE